MYLVIISRAWGGKVLSNILLISLDFGNVVNGFILGS